ncbi:MAG: aromatic ring-hydroxylating oxygenase subunit alpha [Alphaproteobacteria bacterium]
MVRHELIEMAKDAIAHHEADTVQQVPEVMKIKAEVYTDPARFEREKNQIFRRMPLMLAASCELPNAGDYKTMDPIGVPVLLVRGKDGDMRAFFNSCSHRGTNVAVGDGNASRFVCPYHGWTFNQKGALVGVAASEDFGEVDKDENCLKQFPVLEKAGLIWVVLDPDSPLDINKFLSGYDDLLEGFGFEDWHFFERRTLKGPNWKIAYDGYLDFYHLPVLHGNSFGRDISNRGNFYAWGPHQRILAPSPNMPGPDDTNVVAIKDKGEDNWPDEALMEGVWTIFPHVSIASFHGGGRGAMVSQLFPGDTVGESYTVQTYLMAKEPSEEVAAGAHDQFSLLETVVRDEDYATGLRQQKALEAGLTEYVYFGRNEGGGQAFHGWVEKILAAEDDELNDLFS